MFFAIDLSGGFAIISLNKQKQNFQSFIFNNLNNEKNSFVFVPTWLFKFC